VAGAAVEVDEEDGDEDPGDDGSAEGFAAVLVSADESFLL
jgi:hypothetical protein